MDEPKSDGLFDDNLSLYTAFNMHLRSTLTQLRLRSWNSCKRASVIAFVLYSAACCTATAQQPLIELEMLDTDQYGLLGERVVSSRPWLDIRPREIEPTQQDVIAPSALPEDVSGLPPRGEIDWSVQAHSTNLKYRDISRGASQNYRPLYFEDRCLERYGTIGGALKYCPPAHACLHFAFSSVALPVSLIAYPPHRSVSSGSPSRWEGEVQAKAVAQKTANSLLSKLLH